MGRVRLRWTGVMVVVLALLVGWPPGRAVAGTISVPAGGNLQAALDQAAAGDTILLAPGGLYVGNFLIRRPVTIRTYGPLPAGRVSPEWSGQLAIVQSPNNSPALRTAAGVTHVQMIGLEIAPNGHSSGTSILIGSNTETDDAQQPRHVLLDRLLVRGHPASGQKRGLALHGSHIIVTRSHISDMKLAGQDTQAIWINNGWGPYTITDNYLEASGENIMAGGDTPRIEGLVPADILIEGNTIVKPLSWKTESWTVKNLIELKSGRRVTIRGNWLEGSWKSGQIGYGILLTPKDQYGKAPWTTVEDVLVELNVIHEIAEAIRVLGDDHVHPAERARNFTIRHNLLVVDGQTHGGSGRCLVVGRAPQVIEFSQNTCIANGAAAFYTYWGGSVRHVEEGVFRDNVFLHNQYGFSAEGATAGGMVALNLHYSGGVMERNLIGGGSGSRYPADHVLSVAEFQAQFADYGGGNFRLTDTARLRFTGADGRYPGADLDALAVALAGNAPSGPDANELPPVPNDPPVAGQQAVAAVAGVPMTIVLTGSDPDGDVITFAVASGPAHGTLAGTPPFVTYTPAADYAGPDSFTFSVSDGRGGVAAATVTITVSLPNRPPAALSQTVTAATGVPLAIVLTGSDPDGDPVTFAIASGPAHGTVSGTPPSVTYTSAVNYEGPDSFTFSASDGRGGMAIGTIQVDVTAAPPTLPAGWSSRDIGAVSPAGSATVSGGTFTLAGAGADIWGSADAFHFAYQTLTGDGSITARVATLEAVDVWAKAGVMMRETLAANAKHAMVIVSPSRGAAFQRRVATGGTSVHTSGGSGTAPYWVRLVRTGNTFSGFTSSNGTSWTLVDRDTIAMGATIYVGLPITSHKNGMLARTTADHVQVTTAATGTGPLPVGWSSRDVGAVSPGGSATASGGRFTLAGAGADIWGSADAFHFAYQTLTGDGSITAQVATLQAVDVWTKAGVMMRETLAANAKHAMVIVSPSRGVAFQRRLATGGTSVHTSGGSGTAPHWVRLVRSGHTFSAFTSSDGTTWTLIDRVTISMGATIYVGLPITSHKKGTLATTTIEGVHVTGP